MLKASPILSSADASPTIGFRHMPARFSQGSPRQPTQRRSSNATPSNASSPMTSPLAAARRAASLQSLVAPTQKAPKSTSTSSSPPSIEASASGNTAPAQSGDDNKTAHTVGQPGQNALPPSRPQPTEASAASQMPPQPNSNGHGPTALVPSIVSPNKRRCSPPATAAVVTPPKSASAPDSQPAAATGENVTPAKRLRADEPPVKILPQKYEFCAVPDIVELIAHMIAELITTNDAIQMSNGTLTRFHSRTPPGISVRDYLHRLARHATLTPPLLLAMVYYIDRLCAMYREFTINTLTVHRFLITAATVAAKGLSDAFWNNTTYARVGGVRVAELKLLELEFLYRVDWKIVPSPEVLVAYYQGLVERTPGFGFDEDVSSSGSDKDADEDEEGDKDLQGGDGKS